MNEAQLILDFRRRKWLAFQTALPIQIRIWSQLFTEKKKLSSLFVSRPCGTTTKARIFVWLCAVCPSVQLKNILKFARRHTPPFYSFLSFCTSSKLLLQHILRSAAQQSFSDALQKILKNKKEKKDRTGRSFAEANIWNKSAFVIPFERKSEKKTGIDENVH